MTTLAELLIEDKNGSVWAQQVAPLWRHNMRLEKLEIVDGEVIAVHVVDEYETFVVERDKDYQEQYEQGWDFDEQEDLLLFWQQVFFVIDNFEHEFSVRMPFPSGGYEFSCIDDKKGYVHQCYLIYSYAEAREMFIEYLKTLK